MEAPAPAAGQAASAPAVSPPQTAPAQFARRNEDQDRDRRGRRSRRRRPRGRGLTRIEVFLTRAACGSRACVACRCGRSREAEAEAEAEMDTAEDMVVLPGESLAKYREPEEMEPRAPDPSEAPEILSGAAEPALPETAEVPEAEPMTAEAGEDETPAFLCRRDWPKPSKRPKAHPRARKPRRAHEVPADEASCRSRQRPLANSRGGRGIGSRTRPHTHQPYRHPARAGSTLYASRLSPHAAQRPRRRRRLPAARRP